MSWCVGMCVMFSYVVVHMAALQLVVQGEAVAGEGERGCT